MSTSPQVVAAAAVRSRLEALTTPARGLPLPAVPTQRPADGVACTGHGVQDAGGAAVVTLFERRLPGAVAVIDLLAVGAGGVYVVDAADCGGRQVHRHVTGRLLGRRAESLLVGGDEVTPLLTTLVDEVGAVARVLARAGLTHVPVRGVLCLTGADHGEPRGRFALDGVQVLGPGRLAARLVAPGGVDMATREQAAAVLAGALPPA